jgi:hypothetical protein
MTLREIGQKLGGMSYAAVSDAVRRTRKRLVQADERGLVKRLREIRKNLESLDATPSFDLDIDHCFPYSAWPCGPNLGINRETAERYLRLARPAKPAFRPSALKERLK